MRAEFQIDAGAAQPGKRAPLETDPSLPAIRSLLAAASRRQTKGVHYFCDASVLSAGGIPSIVFGPGDIALAHAAEEYVMVAEIEIACAALTSLITDWCGVAH